MDKIPELQQIAADNYNVLYYLFHVTAGSLMALSMVTGLSYHFWNIIIWYGLIPASWIYMISRRTTLWLNLISVALLGYLLTVNWNLWFDESVKFLNLLVSKWGTDYRIVSVIICLVLPWLIYGALAGFLYQRKGLRVFFKTSMSILLALIIMYPVSIWVLEVVAQDGKARRIDNIYEKRKPFLEHGAPITCISKKSLQVFLN